MPARHVFKFAVAGIELSPEHQRIIADRVAEAGVEALASLDIAPHDQFLIDIREWLGRWLLLLDAERIAEEGLEISAEAIQAVRSGREL